MNLRAGEMYRAGRVGRKKEKGKYVIIQLYPYFKEKNKLCAWIR